MSDDKQTRERPKQAERKTPAEWAITLKHVRPVGKGAKRKTLPTRAYAMAESFYRWREQAHHWGPRSLVLTKTDYLAAIEAAEKYPTTPLHAPAISRVIAERQPPQK